LYCGIQKKIDKQLLGNPLNFNLDIKKNKANFNDVVISNVEIVDDNNFILKVKPPLLDAIYKSEKRTFSLSYTSKQNTLKTEKSVILGSFIKTYHLRPYILKNDMNIYSACISIFIIITIIIMLVTPLSNKFKFKKRFIKKYYNTDSDQENAELLDPFTFVTIEENDEIVTMNDKTMLLSSWKRLNELPESKTAKEHPEFFKERLQGTFFNPKTEQLKRINKLWFSVIGIFLGWILFSILINHKQEFIVNGILLIFDFGDLQVSSMIASNLLLGSVLGICFGFISELPLLLNKKRKSNIYLYIKSAITKALLIFSIFLLYALFNAYVIQDYYLNSLIGGVLIAYAILVPIYLEKTQKVPYIPIIISGCLACCFYFMIIQIDPKANSLNTMLPILFFLLSAVIIQEIVIQLFTNRKEISNSLKNLKAPKLKKKKKNIEKEIIEDTKTNNPQTPKEVNILGESRLGQSNKEREITL